MLQNQYGGYFNKQMHSDTDIASSRFTDIC